MYFFPSFFKLPVFLLTSVALRFVGTMGAGRSLGVLSSDPVNSVALILVVQGINSPV